jgi:hypothetical protein
MVRSKAALSLATLIILGLAEPGQASGLGGEVNYGHAEGREGAELGAGYALSLEGFSLTPGAGLFVRDGDTKVYGRVEAAYTLPAAMSIGVGLRIAEETRPYATVALPILPKLALKGNVGAHYYAIGLKVGY